MKIEKNETMEFVPFSITITFETKEDIEKWKLDLNDTDIVEYDDVIDMNYNKPINKITKLIKFGYLRDEKGGHSEKNNKRARS